VNEAGKVGGGSGALPKGRKGVAEGCDKNEKARGRGEVIGGEWRRRERRKARAAGQRKKRGKEQSGGRGEKGGRRKVKGV